MKDGVRIGKLELPNTASLKTASRIFISGDASGFGSARKLLHSFPRSTDRKIEGVSMILKMWFVGLSMALCLTSHAAVPPGMQDSELKDTLVFLRQERLLVTFSDILLTESKLAFAAGTIAFAPVPTLLVLPSFRKVLAARWRRLNATELTGAALGLVLGSVGINYVARFGRANFDRDWLIERQHFRDMKRFFNSPLEVQYVIASDNSDLREYLTELTTWIKASKANTETVTPSLKYEHLVPTRR